MRLVDPAGQDELRMSSGAPFPKRYRRKYSRTKDGCLSCRSCRKKCDGCKPVCGFCLRNRLDCQWPNLEMNPGTGKTDVVTQKQRTDSCTNRNSKTDHDGRRPNHHYCTRSDICCSGDENVTSGDNDSGDTSQSATPPPSKMCNMRRDGSKDSSEANSNQLPADLRYSVPLSQSLTQRGRPAVSSVVTIASPAANRMQLFNICLSTYIPSNVLPQERDGNVHLMYFGFLEELARVHCSQPALITAMSALSLVSVGSMIRDPEMLRKSSEEYSSSVNLLAAAVQRPDSVRDDGLLAAIMVLATCEFYEPFKQKSQAQGYYSHIVGLHSLLAARGPHPPKSRLISFVLAKAKASSISKSMISHQRDFHEAPGWRELNLNVPSLDHDRSYDLGIRISQLFARNDHLDLIGPRSLQEIDELLQDGACLECDLRSDLDHHVPSTWTSTGLSVSLEDIEHFPRFCTLVSDRTLLSAHRFPSYTIAYRYTSYWIRVAMLRTVVKTLQTKRYLLSTDDLPSFAHGFGKPVTESELRHYVICLCRNLPFFAEPACASAGDICSFFPLSWAGKYFAERKDAAWSAWVEDVREHLFVRGVSCPALSWVKTPEALDVDSR